MQESLQQKLVDLMGMKTASPFSRGSAGLYALLAAIEKNAGPGEVIIPTLCCESVALAGLYAGHTVIFADVSEESLCVTPQTLAPLMSTRTRAVVIVHLFGIDANAACFDTLRAQHPDAVFIEDIAHALGGLDRNGKFLGGALDFTLISFADSKIVAGDGGMLLFGVNTPKPEQVSVELSMHVARKTTPRLALSMRNLVHGISDLWREEEGKRGPPIFPEMIEHYRNLIVTPGGIADEQAAHNGIDSLREIRKFRFRSYERYLTGISSPSVSIPYYHEGSTCWRCPLVFERPAQALAATDALRIEDIPASNHYFPLNVLFDKPTCPQGESVALRIVNLWTDDTIYPDKLEKSIDIINQLL